MLSLRDRIESSLADAETSWSVGCFGAIAEFHWTRDEESHPTQPLGRESSRGSIAIDPSALTSEAQGLAWEAAGGHGRGWTQGFVVHVPSGEARMGGRRELTRIGDDEEGAIYDIGIGAADVDACVVTPDPELAHALDRSVGQSILEDGNPAMAAIKEASPIRLFRSKAAEVRVRQRIGSRTGLPTPTGPHTHVIRNLLKRALPHEARIPVPEGRSVVFSMYPPNPIRDELGEPKPFDRSQWDSFQALLAECGPPGYAAAKRALIAEATGDEPCSAPSDQGLARILLPQLAFLDVPAERLEQLAAAWGLSHILEGIQAEFAELSTKKGASAVKRAH